MNLLLLLSLLIYSSMHTAGTETLHVSQTEGRIAVLHCGRLTNGKVTWSRETNGQRVDILTTHNRQTTKHITDPDGRYGSQADLALIIRRVSQSDAGRYDCSGATVELSLTSGTGPNSITTPKTTTISTPTTPATTTTTSTPATPATTTTTSTAKRTATNTTEASTTTEDLWKVLTTVTVSCLVAVVLVLLSWICFYKRKGYAVKHNQEHVYDSIDDTMPTAQPVSDQQRTEEPIYYLATDPGAQTTDNQQSAYEAIDPPEEHSTPQERVDQLCGLIKKPTK